MDKWAGELAGKEMEEARRTQNEGGGLLATEGAKGSGRGRTEAGNGEYPSLPFRTGSGARKRSRSRSGSAGGGKGSRSKKRGGRPTPIQVEPLMSGAL